jgi:hypothetical protein
MSLFLEAFERIFHKALSLAASHSTWKVSMVWSYTGVLTEGGSIKSPRGNGSLIKTVYDGSELDIVHVVVIMPPGLTMFLYRSLGAKIRFEAS